ncbi:hypothetical protein UlMin_024806 [Ulmus minor]
MCPILGCCDVLGTSKIGFDIVTSDVHMPDMDGFKLLEHLGWRWICLSSVMMSADDGKAVVIKGVTHRACDYLIKHVRMEALKNIWQHVVRKKKNEWKDLEQSGTNEWTWRSLKKRKEEDDDNEERDDSLTLKKPLVVWSIELHQQFVAIVNQLGIDSAVLKKILQLMNVLGLTRENVASHLQKYRLYLRRISDVSQHQTSLSSPFINPQDANFGSLRSLSGIDL